MKIRNIYTYFETFIRLKSSIRPKDEQLTHTEQMFLIYCCVYNYNGGDLNDYDKLYENVSKDLAFISRRNDLSGYKLKMSVKKWAKSGRNVFQLIDSLNSVNEGFRYKRVSKGKEYYTDTLDFNIYVELENDRNEKENRESSILLANS